VAVQFGGCEGQQPNCLPIFPGWNYMVRLYRPGPKSWTEHGRSPKRCPCSKGRTANSGSHVLRCHGEDDVTRCERSCERERAGVTAVYLTLPQVLERYEGRWSRWTIYEWTRHGRIPHRKMPGAAISSFPWRAGGARGRRCVGDEQARGLRPDRPSGRPLRPR
jgi:hypothetical protein